MSQLLKRALTLDRWRWDPRQFFIDTTPYKPWGFQGTMLDWARDLNNRRMIIVGGTGGGKALSLNTPILTSNGFVTMDQIMVGDTIFGPDGNPTKVTGVYDLQFNQRCYEIVFSDGSIIVASGDHLWKTLDAKERKNASRRLDNTPIAKLRSTEEIYNTLIGNGGRKNHSIDVCAPLKLPYKNLPVDPYVLGLWLGDGTSSRPHITITEEELITEIEARGYHVTQLTDPTNYRINELTHTILRELDILNNKRIPECYLMSSIHQRSELLRGLLDSDGYANDDCEYTTINHQLAEDVYRLIVSLGIKTTICTGKATLNGRIISDKYRLKFLTSINAFSLPRKQANQKRDEFRGTHNKRYIAEVNPVESVPVRCIKVDREDGMFLAGKSLIPTHNTYALANMALWHVICLPPYIKRPWKVAIAAGGLAQSKRTYDYVIEMCANPVISDWILGEPLKSEVRFKDRSWIQPMPSSDTQLFNLHADMFIIDEAAVAGDSVLMHAPRVVSTFNPNRIIISGHFTDDPKCYVSNFVDIWTNDVDYPKTEWSKLHYSSLDVPWIEERDINLAKKIMSQDEFTTIYRAELPVLTNTLFDVQSIRRCRVMEEIHPSGKDPILMAVDWGFGPSAAAILVAEVIEAEDPLDNDYNILYAQEYPQKTGPWMQQEIDKVAKRFNVQAIRADSSHSQENYRLKRKGWVVEEMVFRALKGRMQERLRVLIEREKIRIWNIFDDLLKELVAYRLDTKKDDHLVDCLQMLVWQQPQQYMGDFYYVKKKYGGPRKYR